MRLELRGLNFSYPNPRRGGPGGPVLSGIELDVPEGEFFTLLGPSGCGKTTLLWLIAGFLAPSGGEILFDGEPAAPLPPEKREVGVVFQNYALFPSMSVFDNVEFGPRSRKASRAEARERAERALELAGLPGVGLRRPSELSGGQQQRVALARAVASRPRILLMDEPLSNLDASLRLETRRRLKALQRELGTTTVYVTHDQEEAFALSDRLAVMNAGRLEQAGPPEELYLKPGSAFAARFLGRCNLFPAKLDNGRASVEGIGEFEAPPRASSLPEGASEALLLVRPERLRPVQSGECGEAPPARLKGRLAAREYLGEKLALGVDSPALPDELVESALHGLEASRGPAKIGAEVELAFDPAECWLLPKDEA